MKKKKPISGYQEKPKKTKIKKKHYVSNLFIMPNKNVSITEKIIKFLIYIALRITIRPKKWKDPKKNYEIIDRTYKRIINADFIFIPSSIAFYLIMAFMPILAMIAFVYQIPGIKEYFVELDSRGSGLSSVIGKFVPGASNLLKQVSGVIKGGSSSGNATASIEAGALVATIFSFVVSAWIAAGGFAKLVFTQSYLYEHKFVGGYWMNKLKGMLMVISFTLFLVFALTFNVTMNEWINGSKMNQPAKMFLQYFFLIIGLFVGIFSGFIILYKFSPRFKIRIKDVLPGAMVSTIPTAGFLTLFGTISSIWSYGNYGSIGTIMYIGMSALIITYFIYVGLATNVAYYKTFVAKKMQTKWTLSKK